MSKLKIATYNINCFLYAKQVEEICQEIKEIDPDIIALQEVDWHSRRSGPANQVKLAAEKCGYPYWYFGIANIHPKYGGLYGHGILSKYPLLTSETRVFAFQPEEPRSFERHELDIDGKKLVLYNTHLCLGANENRLKQIKEIFDLMEKDEYAVLTGDLNMQPEVFTPLLNKEKFTSLNGDGTEGFGYKSCPEAERSSVTIDHIIVSNTLRFPQYEEHIGVKINRSPWSDHNMVYTTIEF